VTEEAAITISIDADGLTAKMPGSAYDGEYYVLEGIENVKWDDLPNEDYPLAMVLGPAKNVSILPDYRAVKLLRAVIVCIGLELAVAGVVVLSIWCGR
jgi:hypothetical protein